MEVDMDVEEGVDVDVEVHRGTCRRGSEQRCGIGHRGRCRSGHGCGGAWTWM